MVQFHWPRASMHHLAIEFDILGERMRERKWASNNQRSSTHIKWLYFNTFFTHTGDGRKIDGDDDEDSNRMAAAPLNCISISKNDANHLNSFAVKSECCMASGRCLVTVVAYVLFVLNLFLWEKMKNVIVCWGFWTSSRVARKQHLV